MPLFNSELGLYLTYIYILGLLTELVLIEGSLGLSVITCTFVVSSLFVSVGGG